MDGMRKLAFVARQTDLEDAEEVGPGSSHARRACGYTPAELRRRFGGRTSLKAENGNAIPIHMAAMPGGRRVALLKAMLTTACERDCNYCPFRAGRDSRRATFKPEELARSFDAVHRAGQVDGLFLSSGILAGGTKTQDRLIDTAEILRLKLGYQGYLHLKIMPGAERDQVLRAMQLADRISINLEAPNPERLDRLAPNKDYFNELLRPFQWVEEIRRETPRQAGWAGRWPSTTTQFVVGAVGESDLEILSTVERLNRRYDLRRAYFKSFTPVEGTPFEDLPPEEPRRQDRLYQASFLLRDYGFDLEELPFSAAGRLPLERDPKLAVAQVTLAEAPIELNRAERQELLRVPGIGPRGAAAILRARRGGRLRQLGDLQKLGVAASRAAPYITLDGRRPIRQLALF